MRFCASPSRADREWQSPALLAGSTLMIRRCPGPLSANSSTAQPTTAAPKRYLFMLSPHNQISNSIFRSVAAGNCGGSGGNGAASRTARCAEKIQRADCRCVCDHCTDPGSPSRRAACVNVTATCGAVRSADRVAGLPVPRHLVAQQLGIPAELGAERRIVADPHAAAAASCRTSASSPPGPLAVDLVGQYPSAARETCWRARPLPRAALARVAALDGNGIRVRRLRLRLRLGFGRRRRHQRFGIVGHRVLRPAAVGSGMRATGFTATAPMPPPLGSPHCSALPARTQVYDSSAAADRHVQRQRPDQGTADSGSGWSRMSACAAIYLRPLAARILRLRHHVDLEARRAQLRHHLRDRVPDGLLVGPHVDRLAPCRSAAGSRPAGR